MTPRATRCAMDFARWGTPKCATFAWARSSTSSWTRPTPRRRGSALKSMCRELLANPVIETFEIQLTEVAEG